MTLVSILLMSSMFDGSCLSSGLATEFRAAYAPGFTAGVTQAITDPANADAGIREAFAAFVQGIGAVIQPADTPSSSSGSGSSSTSSTTTTSSSSSNTSAGA